MIELKDIQEVVADLKRMKENTEKFIEREKDTMKSATRSMLLSDINLLKTYAEIASDLTEEDIENQELINDFLVQKDRAVAGTLYNETIKPVEETLI